MLPRELRRLILDNFSQNWYFGHAFRLLRITSNVDDTTRLESPEIWRLVELVQDIEIEVIVDAESGRWLERERRRYISYFIFQCMPAMSCYYLCIEWKDHLYNVYNTSYHLLRYSHTSYGRTGSCLGTHSNNSCPCATFLPLHQRVTHFHPAPNDENLFRLFHWVIWSLSCCWSIICTSSVVWETRWILPSLAITQ